MHKSTGSHDWPSRTFQPLRTAAKYLLSLRVKSGHPNDAQRPAIRVSLTGHTSCRATHVQGIPLRIGAGFWMGGNSQPENLGRQIGDNPRAIGHPGAGGSIAWADPDKRLAVAICHNRMFLPPNTAQDPIRQATLAQTDRHNPHPR